MYIYRLYMKAEFYCIYCSREFRQPWQIVVPPRVTPSPFSTSMAIEIQWKEKTPASDLFFSCLFLLLPHHSVRRIFPFLSFF